MVILSTFGIIFTSTSQAKDHGKTINCRELACAATRDQEQENDSIESSEELEEELEQESEEEQDGNNEKDE